MKKSLSFLAGAVMSFVVVTGHAQNVNGITMPNASSVNSSGDKTTDPRSKLSTNSLNGKAAPTPDPSVTVAEFDLENACKQSLDHLDALRAKMKVAVGGDQPGLQLSMQRALLTVLKDCADLHASTVSPEKFETMIRFADQLSNNKYMGLTFAEERYLREKVETIHSNVLKYLSTQVIDAQLLEEDVKRKQFSNSNKLENLNHAKTVQCEDAWLDIMSAFSIINNMQTLSPINESFDTINKKQFADAMQRNFKVIQLVLKNIISQNIIKLGSGNCMKAAKLGVEQAYLPTSLYMTFYAAKQNEKMRNAICNLDPNQEVGPKYWYQQAVKARVGFGSGSPGEPNARLMLIPGKNWEYECPMDMSKFD